jgi:hypothetical protein
MKTVAETIYGSHRYVQAFAIWLERHPLPVLAVLSLGYFSAAFVLCNYKLMWDDEFFTLYISYAGYEGAWEALLTGADQHPPSYYWITYTVLELFGFSQISVRLPAIAGFWLLQVSLYVTASRKWSNSAGYFAFVFPAATEAFSWAFDARGYGLAMGFAGASYMFWEMAADRVKRPATTILFACSLALAVGSHYYAILILGPFAVGTAVLAIQRRKLDLPLAIAHLAALVPIAAFWPVIEKARGYSDHFWATPYYSQIEESLDIVFTSGGYVLFVPLALALAAALAAGVKAAPSSQGPAPAKDSLWASGLVLLGLAMLPMAGYLLGILVTNAFTPRYALTGIVGTTVILAGVLSVLTGASSWIRPVILALMVAGVALEIPGYHATYVREKRELDYSSGLVEKYSARGRPVVISEVSVFHRLAYYAEPHVKSQIRYLSFPEASIRWLGHDTIDRGLVDLAKWFHPGTVLYREFLKEHDSFYIHGYIGDWTWLTYQLIEDGFQLTVLERRNRRLVMRADRRMPLANSVM